MPANPHPTPQLLTLYAIYSHPTDYPLHFVVRRWYITPAQHYADPNPFSLSLSLHEARATLPPNLSRIDRSPTDDPVILETWL